jgi:hypothetical protein
MVGKVVIETDVFSISYNDLYDDLLPIEERERLGSFDGICLCRKGFH